MVLVYFMMALSALLLVLLTVLVRVGSYVMFEPSSVLGGAHSDDQCYDCALAEQQYQKILASLPRNDPPPVIGIDLDDIYTQMA